jgi:hypothetical protein
LIVFISVINLIHYNTNEGFSVVAHELEPPAHLALMVTRVSLLTFTEKLAFPERPAFNFTDVDSPVERLTVIV